MISASNARAGTGRAPSPEAFTGITFAKILSLDTDLHVELHGRTGRVPRILHAETPFNLEESKSPITGAASPFHCSLASQLTWSQRKEFGPRIIALKRPMTVPLLSMRELIVLSVFFFSASPVFAIPPSLSIETLNVRQQGTISFAVFAVGPTAPPSGGDLVSAETEDHKFKIAVDLKSIRAGRFETFVAEIYVQPGAPIGSPVYKFAITGSPIGPFLDVNDRITLHVQSGTQDSKGYLNMPLHSGGQVDLLAADPISQPLEIKLGEDTGVQLPIKNRLENLKVVITSIDVAHSCNTCWKTPSQLPQTPIIVDENGSTTLLVNVTPNSLKALGKSAFALKSEQPHDTFNVQVYYNADYGGQPRRQQFIVPVRFAPSIWALITAVGIGAGLGFLAKIVLDQNSRASFRAVLSTAGTSLVLVTIVEVVAFAVASYGGTKVVIFTFDLDPQQFLPTIVIGMLVSGGPAVVSYLKQVFGQSGTSV